MLDHGVQKLKNELNISSLKNSDLQASVIGVNDRVHNSDEDIIHVLSERMEKVVDKLFVDSSFYDANRDL